MRRRLSSSGTCRGRVCASSSRGGRTRPGIARRVVSGCRRNCVESASSSRPCTTTPLPFSRRAPTCTSGSLPVSARAHLRLVHVVPYSDPYHPRSQVSRGGERLPTRHGVDKLRHAVPPGQTVEGPARAPSVRAVKQSSARPLREQWRAWRSPRTEATAMHNDTSAPLHICPDCVNRVNGDPAPAPDGWEYGWSIARYGKITTTGARYVESSDSHTGGCELCMEDHEDGLREVWAAPLTNASTTPLTTHEDVPVADSPGDVT